MKLRFGIDEAARARIREALDAQCNEPPIGRRLSYVYLDTPDGALASRGVVVRFRRSAALGTRSPRRPWKGQSLWPKDWSEPKRVKRLGIAKLQQRLDATFDVRIRRWTWTIGDGWARVSLDSSAVSTGRDREVFAELRVVCKKRHRDAGMTLAVELGATHLASLKARDRGLALVSRPNEPSPDEP